MKTPHFFISCGDHDCLVAPNSSYIFDTALTAINKSHTYELIAGQGHGGSFWHNTAQDAKYLAFFNTSLDGNCGTSGIKATQGKAEKLHIWPNPATNQLNISLPENELTEIQIIDIAGKELLKNSMVKGNVTIDINHFKDGFYYVVARNTRIYRSALIVM